MRRSCASRQAPGYGMASSASPSAIAAAFHSSRSIVSAYASASTSDPNTAGIHGPSPRSGMVVDTTHTLTFMVISYDGIANIWRRVGRVTLAVRVQLPNRNRPASGQRRLEQVDVGVRAGIPGHRWLRWEVRQ